jgi:hypothetical protein
VCVENGVPQVGLGDGYVNAWASGTPATLPKTTWSPVDLASTVYTDGNWAQIGTTGVYAYTVPHSGRYLVTATLSLTQTTSGTVYLGIGVYASSAWTNTWNLGEFPAMGTGQTPYNATTIVQLTAGQVIGLMANPQGSIATIAIGTGNSNFIVERLP